MPPIDGERRSMDQFILEALTRVEAHMAQLEQKVTNLQLEIAQRPTPARPCDFFKEHLEDHKREDQAVKDFWYKRLGAVLDALWKPVLAILLLGAVLSGQIKNDLLRGDNAPSTPQSKEVTK